MLSFYKRLKDYIVLVRSYSIIDVVLLFLLTRTLSVTSLQFGTKDFFVEASVLCLWGFLTLTLEAKHQHAYRAHISYFWPMIFALVAMSISLYYNPLSLPFLFSVILFTFFYIKKESTAFWGATSSLWRGFFQASLFFYSLSLYKNVYDFTTTDILIGCAFCFMILARNLIADVRDADFDELTFSVQYGNKESYIVALGASLVSGISLLVGLHNPLIVIPIFAIGTILLWYDDGFTLHRISIMVTSFTAVNIIFSMQGFSLLYPNLLFFGILSNFLFYEKVARPSNPLPRVNHQARYLFHGANTITRTPVAFEQTTDRPPQDSPSAPENR